MIFLDTSAIYALADRADPNHQRAARHFATALASEERFLTHSYVLVESMALLQHRLGLAQALAFAEDARKFEVEWVTSAVHARAVARLRKAGRRQMSLVDCVSFLTMQARGVDTAFAFDTHFEDEGFRILGYK